MVTYPDGYYSRFDASKNYDQLLFRAGKVGQSAEWNDLQLAGQARLKGVADALFRDGDIVRDAGLSFDDTTGHATLESGAIYLNGAVRGVPPGTLTVPLTGSQQIGVFLQQVVVTDNDDPVIRDPALGASNYGLAGAFRLQVNPVWGLAGSGAAGDFYAVYTVVDGVVLSNNPPPSVDTVALAIAAYDRQSSGGCYVVSGGAVLQLADDSGGNQVYSLSEGTFRVNGTEVDLPHARRVTYAAVPDLKQVLSEPQTVAGGTEVIGLNHGPISSVDQVLITARKVVTVTHGAYSGVQDALPDSPILAIVAVNQGGAWTGTTFTGGTNYVASTDYKLTADKVDWSLGSANQPAPGSTYTVVYNYLQSITPSVVAEQAITISGALAGSVAQITYKWKRPRIDKLCLDATGAVVWITGVAADVAPQKPAVPPALLAIASVTQTWTSSRSVANDGTRVTSMDGLANMQAQIDNLYALVSEQALNTAVAISDPTTKRGVFVDPLTDDDERDAGLAQDAAVYGGVMTLPIVDVVVANASLAADATLPMNTAGAVAVVAQLLKTACFPVNPYMAFAPLPAACTITPATDFWTETETTWDSPITERFETDQSVVSGLYGLGWLQRVVGTSQQIVVTQSTAVVSSSTEAAEDLRQISIAFVVTGMGPGEVLNTVTFDGRTVDFTA